MGSQIVWHNWATNWSELNTFYTSKNILGTLLVIVILVLLTPDLPGDLDNYIPANPLNVPPHLKPEWKTSTSAVLHTQFYKQLLINLEKY